MSALLPTASDAPSASNEAAWDALLDDDAALAAGVAEIGRRHGVPASLPQRYTSGSLPVYALADRHVLKLFPPHEHEHAHVEARVLAALHGRLPLPTPQLHAAEQLDGWPYLLMSQLHGDRLVDAWPRLEPADRYALADDLGRAVAALHALEVAPLVDLPPRWDAFAAAQRVSAAERQRARGLAASWVEQVEPFLTRWAPAPAAPHVLLHTELMREHLLVQHDGTRWRCSGLFDFEPAMVGPREYDFASFGLFVSCGDARFLRRALLAYGYAPAALDAALSCRLMAYALLHRYSHLRWYLERLPPGEATTLEQLAERWWGVDAPGPA
jgi:hygromycin-B 7''-O-kinase